MSSEETDPEIFLVAPPGLESVLCAEAREKGFRRAKTVPGGVTCFGDRSEVWRANLVLRGASRVLVRIAEFRADNLSLLAKRARGIEWREFLRTDRPVRVDATCRKSKIYHSGAAAERVSNAIADTIGAPLSETAEVRVVLRIERDQCTLSLDASGEPLHKRGFKSAVSKAPMRETLAALFLRQSVFSGEEAVIDPMCGSGTFVIEAAEIARGLAPGRERSFAFEALSSFDAEAWQALKADQAIQETPHRFFGFDRNDGAVQASTQNAARSGVSACTQFQAQAISDLSPPDGVEPGLVILNPPYGARIGEVKALFPLYGRIGKTLSTRFQGWRVGLITSQDSLAQSTGLPFERTSEIVDHGGLKIKLHFAKALP